jgi:hypothetical protein
MACGQAAFVDSCVDAGKMEIDERATGSRWSNRSLPPANHSIGPGGR